MRPVGADCKVEVSDRLRLGADTLAGWHVSASIRHDADLRVSVLLFKICRSKQADYPSVSRPYTYLV
jgi:hypothetical protein